MIKIQLTDLEAMDVVVWCRSYECSDPGSKDEQLIEKRLREVADKIKNAQSGNKQTPRTP